MAEERLEQLLAGYADGALDEREEVELKTQLVASPELQRRLARALIVGRLLREATKPAVDAARVLAALPRERGATVAAVMRDITPPPRRRVPAAVWGGAFALAAAAVVMVFTRGDRVHQGAPRTAAAPASQPTGAAATAASAGTPPGVRALVEELEGQVWRRHGEGSVRAYHNDAVAPGETLRTSAGQGSAVLRFGDGTRVALGPASELAVSSAPATDPTPASSVSVSLAAGTLVVEAGPSLRRLATPLASVVPAPGARVRVSATGPRVRVEVRAGRARVEPAHGGRAADVLAGQYAALTAEEGAAAAPVFQIGRALPRALLIMGTINKNRRLDADDLVRARLERLGFEAVPRTDATATTTDARDAAVVFISSSVDVEHIGPRFRTIDVPVVIAEPWLLDEMGMTAAGRTDNQGFWNDELVLVAPGHPLSAGLTGRVKIASTRIVTGWGRPNGVAVTVAAAADGALERSTIFAYEKGAAMPGLEAPARRVHFFMHDAAALSLTDAGWSLFDAAIRWAAGF